MTMPLLFVSVLAGLVLQADANIHTSRVFGPEIPGRYKHPASLTELSNGDLYLVYYGGSGEYAADSAVYGRACAGRIPLVEARAHHSQSEVPGRQRRRLAVSRRLGLAIQCDPSRRDLVHVAHRRPGIA